MSQNQYWASKTPRECVQECVSRTSEYYRFINEKGIKFVWMLVHLFKHSATERQTLSTAVGEYSELQQVRVNDFRGLLQHKVGIIKNQKATWEPMAVNDDVTSLAQTKIARSILDEYTVHKDYDKKFNDLTMHTVSFGEAFMLQTWDSTKGKLLKTHQKYGKDENGQDVALKNVDGTPQTFNEYEGDVEARVYEPLDVIRDCYIMNQEQNHWYIFRERYNKWDLAAKYPALYDKIVNKTLETEYQEYYQDVTPYQKSQDLITLYTFVHKKTPALPDGRLIKYIDEDIILSSEPLLYEDTPWHRMVDTPINGSNFSYTDAFDLLQVEDLCDGLWSTIITNQRMFGVQNIIMPKGSDISETDLMGMMNLITYDPTTGGKPEALQLLATPKEIFESLGLLEQKKNTIIGVNSTAQGNPPNDVSSGVAISMLQSLNVQYNQGAQGSYIEVMTSVGTALLNILKKNAKSERLIEFTGTSSRSLLQKFTGSDISSIARVRAVPGNPLTQTTQGRFTLAQQYAQLGFVKTPSDMAEVMETGSLDVATDGAEMQELYALQENEDLMQGNDIPVHPFDDHITHLKKHVALISDLSVRRGKTVTQTNPQTGQVTSTVDPKSNPEGQKILTAVQNHMMQHAQALQNPAYAPILQAIGYQTEAQPPAAPPNAPPVGAPAPGTVNVQNKVGPSPANGVNPAPAAATQTPAVAPPKGGPTHTGALPQAAIKTAQRASQPPKQP